MVMSLLTATDLVLYGKVRVTVLPVFFMLSPHVPEQQQQKHYLVFTSEN